MIQILEIKLNIDSVWFYYLYPWLQLGTSLGLTIFQKSKSGKTQNDTSDS